MSSPLTLVFAGTPDVALPSLEALLGSRHRVAAVITQPDAQSGRGRKVHPSAVKRFAVQHNIEVLTPAKLGAETFQQRLREINPDCCPVVAYGKLIPTRVLSIPRYGWVNLHFSLLPAWRGAAPVQAAIKHGDVETGASVFQIVPELDAGPVYGSVAETLSPTDTAGQVLQRLSHTSAQLLVDVLDGISAGVLAAHEQSAHGVSYAPKITSEDAHIRWDTPAFAVDRAIRALTPEPGAWALFRDMRVKLGPVIRAACPAQLSAGQLWVTKKNVWVGTLTDPVLLTEVQAPGKKKMPAADWARGHHIDNSEVFS